MGYVCKGMCIDLVCYCVSFTCRTL